jgi:hypothetical protein
MDGSSESIFGGKMIAWLVSYLGESVFHECPGARPPPGLYFMYLWLSLEAFVLLS